MLALSLGVHLTIAFLFASSLFPSTSRDIRPLYYVDLVNLPVPDPQAGRPDARPAVEKAPEEPVKAEPAVVAPPEPPKPPPVLLKPEPVKPLTKEPPTKTENDEYKGTTNRIKKMQLEQDKNRRIAEMKAEASRSVPVEAPVGEPDGKGTTVGVFHSDWLAGNLKEQWSFSPYLADNRQDLQVEVDLFFDTGGRLYDYKFLKKSGNEQFDKSILNAILKFTKEQLLPNPPKEKSVFSITFNLKDLKR